MYVCLLLLLLFFVDFVVVVVVVVAVVGVVFVSPSLRHDIFSTFIIAISICITIVIVATIITTMIIIIINVFNILSICFQFTHQHCYRREKYFTARKEHFQEKAKMKKVRIRITDIKARDEKLLSCQGLHKNFNTFLNYVQDLKFVFTFVD